MPRKKRVSSSTLKSPKKIKVETSSGCNDIVNNVNDLYGMKMPNDLYSFWCMCLEINSKSPLGKYFFSICILSSLFSKSAGEKYIPFTINNCSYF